MDIINEVGLSIRFPFADIIKHAFKHSKSDYWVGLALDWYEELDDGSKERLGFDSRILNGKTWVTQFTRHRAFRIIDKK